MSCSHNLEHYYHHDVPRVLAGFLHVLKPHGYAEIRVPDVEAVCREIAVNGRGLDEQFQPNPRGPITARDIRYGWSIEIEQSGADFYAHKTGFTWKTLADSLRRAGFAEVWKAPAGRRLRAARARLGSGSRPGAAPAPRHAGRLTGLRATADALVTLATLAGTRLKARGPKLVTAESCTGGWVAEAVTAIPGSSDWFERGFVTYSNDAKRGCSACAVRRSTGRARSARRRRSRWCTARCAQPGAGGGVDHGRRRPGRRHRDEAGGWVCFGWALAGGNADTTTKHFKGNRGEVRRQSVVFALQGLIERIGE